MCPLIVLRGSQLGVRCEGSDRLFLVEVEMTGIIRRGKSWTPGGWNVQVGELVPIECFEPGVRHDAVSATVDIPKTCSHFNCAKPINQILGICCERAGRQIFALRERDLRLEDLCERLHIIAIFVTKRREPPNHLVQKHSHRPPVACLVNALPHQHLGRHVVRGATLSEGALESPLGILVDAFGKAKITKFDVPEAVEKNVFRLEVAVDILKLVNMLQCEGERASVKSGSTLRQPLLTIHHAEQVTPNCQLHQ
mmetsp:Transcript_2485/g.5138  ORF Transcript_2485/g.5138 Transcript_2485/m.5138 type:complete len:253 (+) Transcript_2485:904-1662(+)